MTKTENPAQWMKDRAKALGFDAVGITTPDAIPHAAQALQDYIARGRHGDMLWMEDRADQRGDPRTLWPDVGSVIALGMSYAPDHDPMENLAQRDTANISVYARGRDYHDVVKKRLKALARDIVDEFGCELKVFVDTAPVMEKPLAQVAGLGWQGKHSNLVSREHGSWLFLGAIYTTLALKPDLKHPHRCGTCRACLDACPTNAFPEPGKVDARRCISYLSIELKGPIPVEFRKAMGNRIYGCDDCLAVCPWNKFASTAREASFHARDELAAPKIGDLLDLDDAQFRALFSKNPIKRIGRDSFIRNVLIAAGNSENRAFLPQIKRLLKDPSPVVRGTAIWAARQLATADEAMRLKNDQEQDASVLKEWD